MNWQKQTYSNGNPTGRIFYQAEDEKTMMRLYQEKDGTRWAMYYPNKHDLSECSQCLMGVPEWFAKLDVPEPDIKD